MGRTIREAFTQMRRTPYQALGAILVLFITFFVGYAFSLLLYGSEHVLRFVETRPQVTAFFKSETAEADIRGIENDMLAKPYVAKVKVVTKNDALALYKEENKRDPLLLELVTADILPASIEVSGRDIGSLEQIQKDLEVYKSKVDEIVFQKNIIDSLARWTMVIRWVGIAIISVLGVTSLIIMMVIISMKVAMKRQEIGIMRLLGATSWYINGPFLIEGVSYGVFGSLLAWGVVTVGVLYATPWIIDFFGEIPVLPIPWSFLAFQIGVGLAVGALSGAIASMLALRRFIK
ncbi:MAG TPA: permease-like cell division protein FtsX [Patescibacteria group bacterium]|nr:permease-like cell division protein FtsX [Patescibacteria group bacterium]